jgi:hypothetical protein
LILQFHPLELRFIRQRVIHNLVKHNRAIGEGEERQQEKDKQQNDTALHEMIAV